ncbi:MAG: exodeoxyribonuclease large subunit [Nocardioidaceae bacterium]|nr:exodeoxyribonuclease large subunit [Nocardioidaceae bacterium]
MALQTSPEHPAPVRQIATLLAGYIDRLGAVWVEGQIAQLNRRQGMNTVFLTLRDPLGDMSVTVTCNRQVIDSADPPVVEGASVVVHGRPRFYPNRGTLSLVADDIRMVGLGELLARLERRRQLLAAEGLFARERKKRLPFLPHRIGLVTARGSAAERDVLENARRRWPAVEFEVAYASMQGPSCCREVIEALQRLDRSAAVDVIVVARGGGSVEDLLPFSDEALVRAVAQAGTPVVSAIGHEPDSPILDLVADLRASTPTDAAKLVVPDVAEEVRRVTQLRDRSAQLLSSLIRHEQAQLTGIRARPCLAQPYTLLDSRSDEVTTLVDRSRRTLRHRLDRGADDVAHARARVRALSPLETLRRGYAVLQDADGHVVTSVDSASPGTRISARVTDGRLDLDVAATHPEPAAETGTDRPRSEDPDKMKKKKKDA